MARTRGQLAAIGFLVLVLCTTGLGTAEAGRFPQASAKFNATLGDCDGAPAGGGVGSVTLRRLPGNAVRVKVEIKNRMPNETYTINRSCHGSIGTIETDANGEGSAEFTTSAQGLNTTTSIVLDIHISTDPYPDRARTSLISLPTL